MSDHVRKQGDPSRGAYDDYEPRVSVIIPVYNAEAYIGKALASVLAQSFDHLEVVVVNDGSWDGTAEVVKKMARGSRCIRLVEQENQGMAGARNRGLANARGECIAFMDADDLWHPQKIEHQMAYLDVHPEVGVVTCYSAILDARGGQMGWRFDGQAQGMVYDKMLKQDLVAGGSVPLIRRDALHVVGPFDEALSLRSDWDMWLRLARRFAFGTVPQVLVGYTRRSGNASQDYEAMIELGASLLQKVAEDDADFKASRYRFCHARDIFAMACLCFIDEDASRAWTYVRRSMGVSVWPVLGSLRRLGMVALITSSTVLPKGAYRLLFRMVARIVFRQQPGQPFLA